MKTKITFISIIAVIVIAVLYFYHDTMSLSEIVSALVGASASIVAVYQWLVKRDKEEVIKQKDEEIRYYKSRRE